MITIDTKITLFQVKSLAKSDHVTKSSTVGTTMLLLCESITETKDSGLSLIHDRLERLLVIHRQVSEDLTIDLDTLLVEHAHELRVGEPLLTCSCIDTLDPEGTESALLDLTIAVSVGKTLLPGILSYRPDITTCAIVATGLLEDSLAPRLGSGMID